MTVTVWKKNEDNCKNMHTCAGTNTDTNRKTHTFNWLFNTTDVVLNVSVKEHLTI